MGLKSAKILAVAALLACAFDVRVNAQSQYIQQSGQVTSGHPGYFLYNGIMADGGPATNGNISELGITANGNFPFCIQTSKNHTSQYSQLCAGITNSAGYFSVTGYNGAVPTFNVIVNGTTYPFPGTANVAGPGSSTVGYLALWNNTSGTLLSSVSPTTFLDQSFGSSVGEILCRDVSGWSVLAPGTSGFVLQSTGNSGCPVWASVNQAATPLRSVASGTTDSITSADANGTIVWNSSSANAKSEALINCILALNGMTVSVKDGIGTAGTYPITVSSNSIDGSGTYYLAFTHQSVTFQCDGSTTNWIVK